MSRGFLRTAAPFRTDLVFTIEMVMGAALLVGMVLARRGYYRANAGCQSAVVLPGDCCGEPGGSWCEQVFEHHDST